MKQLEFTGLPTALQHQLYIDMRFQPAASNNETGKRRLHCTIKYAARLGMISPIFISWLLHILADHEHLFWPMVNTNSGAS